MGESGHWTMGCQSMDMCFTTSALSMIVPTQLPSHVCLINNNDDPLIFTIDQFVDAVGYQVSAGSLKSFSEREVAERTEIFGKIAHRFSTYEARFDPEDPEPLTVGINSIQFIKVDDSWHVSSLVWNDEAEDRKIQEKYILSDV